MTYRLTPIIKEIVSILNKHDLEIKRMRGDHIIINRKEGLPKLKRPIVLVNEKRPSNAVRLNLLKECEEAEINREEFKNIFENI